MKQQQQFERERLCFLKQVCKPSEFSLMELTSKIFLNVKTCKWFIALTLEKVIENEMDFSHVVVK